jgi:hypothetical protein
MMESAPWLKAMENGGLGEARARAFLMDRFWILERSVDIQGVDFFIQRRLVNQNFMDRDAPRLGVVQVKFIQDGNTTISIHKSYLSNAKGAPNDEFFLLVFTGREDSEKSYLLSSVQILKEFYEHVEGERVVLRIQGSKLMANSNYEVLQKKLALDRMENALINASFISNRAFLVGVNYFKIDPGYIDPDLLLPLANTNGSIQKIFCEEKKNLRRVLFDIEEVVEAMHAMLNTTMPEEALRLRKEVIAQHIGGYGRGDICFSSSFFDDEGFFNSVENHRYKLSKLRELGVEGGYFKLIDVFESTVVNRLATDEFYASQKAIRVKILYDSSTLQNVIVEVTENEVDQKKPHIDVSRAGLQIIFFSLGKGMPKDANILDAQEVRVDVLRKELWRFRQPFERAFNAVLFGWDKDEI